MKLSVIIPVFNEERFAATLIERVLSEDLSELNLDLEIVVVDDCSVDGTASALDPFRENPAIRVFRHQKNRGKGAAVRTGIEHASGDVLLVQDADLEYHPKDYGPLLRPILDGEADVVYGSRFVGSGPHRVLYYRNYVGNRVLTMLSNVFTDLNLTDMECGYKVFRADIIKRLRLKENRFGFEPEVTAKVARLFREEDCRIFEVGISYAGRTYGEGKKIGWKDAVSAVRCILRYNLFR